MATVYIKTDRTEEFWDRERPRYPWAQWLDGRLWKLTKGEDFRVDPKVLRNQAHRQGITFNVNVRTHVDGDILWLQSSANPPAE